MIRLRTILPALCFTALVGLAGCSTMPSSQARPEDVGMSTARLDKLGQAFQKEVEAGRLPGGVIAIARQGQLVRLQSFGVQDPGSGAPMRPDAIFRIYSMTKPLVSVAAMLLVEDGVIQLADPVSKFLPEFASMQVSTSKLEADGKTSYQVVPAARPITVQDLLRHTAGLAYGEITTNAPVKEAYAKAGVFRPGVLDYDSRGMSPAEQVTALAKIPLVHQPGTTWEYSLASDLLGRVVEAASGERLGAFLNRRVFVPLNMRDTAFHVPAQKMSRLAQPFPTDPFTKNPNRLLDVSVEPKNDSGGAGAVSTVEDYLKFAQMLLNGGALDGVRILSPSTIRLMASDHVGERRGNPMSPGELLLGSQGYGFGLGFLVRQAPGLAAVLGAPGHFMWAGYGGTYFWVDPAERLTAVLMTQAPGPSRVAYRRLFMNLVYQAIER